MAAQVQGATGAQFSFRSFLPSKRTVLISASAAAAVAVYQYTKCDPNCRMVDESTWWTTKVAEVCDPTPALCQIGKGMALKIIATSGAALAGLKILCKRPAPEPATTPAAAATGSAEQRRPDEGSAETERRGTIGAAAAAAGSAEERRPERSADAERGGTIGAAAAAAAAGPAEARRPERSAEAERGGLIGAGGDGLAHTAVSAAVVDFEGARTDRDY